VKFLPQEEAEESLSYALRNCHRNAPRNRARILKYLVPVGLLLGRLPSPALQRQYPEVLQQYEPLVEAMQTGDVGLFASTLRKQQTTFIQDGTYLLLEKLQASVQRRLLRRVWALHAAEEPSRAAQIPLSMFQDALNALGAELEMDEVECIAANLIFRKYVRGYIAHRAKVMVVAKTDPFPKLESAMLGDT
jgi:nuclear mRNA export protein PCID2/THP1